jgi:hypothetical protein
MSSIYTNAGDETKDHIHRLKHIVNPISGLIAKDEEGNRYVCVTCGARLKLLSGILLTPQLLRDIK